LGVIRPWGEVYKVIPFGRSSFYIPDLSADLFHLSGFKSGNPPESVDHNLTKYCTCLNCDCLDDGDKVIDVGGFIGAVSIGIAEQGAEVIAVEPSERNAECIRRNAAEFDVTDLVTVVQNPVYSSQTEMKLNLSMDRLFNIKFHAIHLLPLSIKTVLSPVYSAYRRGFSSLKQAMQSE
jgi:hypothetical protein